jgi:hypothetical protein
MSRAGTGADLTIGAVLRRSAVGRFVLSTRVALAIGFILYVAWVRAGAEVTASSRLAILVNLFYGEVN